jgi:hypothetical protein
MGALFAKIGTAGENANNAKIAKLKLLMLHQACNLDFLAMPAILAISRNPTVPLP